MQYQASRTPPKQTWKKSPVWEFPHMCGKTHTHKKQKQQNNIKTNKFFMWAPPQLKDSL